MPRGKLNYFEKKDQFSKKLSPEDCKEMYFAEVKGDQVFEVRDKSFIENDPLTILLALESLDDSLHLTLDEGAWLDEDNLGRC